MANNYEYVTIQPSLPRNVVTDSHIELLRACGFGNEPDGDELLYFFCENGVQCPDSEDVGVLDPNAFGVSLKAKVQKQMFSVDYTDVFADILNAAPRGAIENDEIVAEGAYVCDKMRPGEFGGFVIRLTPGKLQFMSTSIALEQMRVGT